MKLTITTMVIYILYFFIVQLLDFTIISRRRSQRRALLQHQSEEMEIEI